MISRLWSRVQRRFVLPGRRCCILLLGGVCLIATGCGGGAAGGDEDLDHHTPPHKPADFTAAVEALDQRLTAGSDFITRPPCDESRQQFRELLDIVRWLPELAGDSDMPEQPWDRVNERSRQWAARLDSCLLDWEHGRKATLPSAEEQQTMIDELNEIAPLTSLTESSATGD